MQLNPEFTLAGYMTTHERAAAFGGADGNAYSCAIYVGPEPDERGLFGAALRPTTSPGAGPATRPSGG
jgi:hypothetical protein